MATSFPEIGARLLSFLSWWAYGKHRNPAVTLDDDGLAGIDRDEKLHQVVVDVSTATL